MVWWPASFLIGPEKVSEFLAADSKDLAQRADLKKAGIYFLVGKDEEDADVVYIGEAEEVYKRLLQHQDKDFWSEALVFISKDDNLNKAHIKHLEFSLHLEVMEVGRYKLLNSNTPNCPSISESDQAVMSEFSENLQLLVGTMGFKFFQKLTKSKVTKHDKYRISAARGAHATAVVTTEGIVVLKDSHIALSEVPSTPAAIIKKRRDLTDSGIVQRKQIHQGLFVFKSINSSSGHHGTECQRSR